MILKGIISLLLVFSIMFQMVSPAFAAGEESEQMEIALVTLKNLIDIPEGYEDFNYSSSEYTYRDYKMNIWEFNWEYKEGSISAAIDEAGNLCSYDKYFYDKETKTLSDISIDDAKKAADSFLRKAVSEYYSEMKLIENNNENSSEDKYTFKYKRYINDIPVDFSNITIKIDKFSGEVKSFDKYNYDNRKLDYPTNKDVISYDEAKKEYINKLGIKLEYRSYYDYKTKSLDIFPVYSIRENTDSAIDANTGEIVNLDMDLELRSLDTLSMKEADAGVEESKLSKEELEAIENVSSLITKENAEGIIRKYFDVIKSDMKLQSVNLSKDFMNNNKYIWEIQFDNGSFGRVDAKTGEVLLFVDGNNEDKEENKLTRSEAQKIAYNFLETVAKEKLSQTKLVELEEKEDDSNDSNVFVFEFIRQVNGIDFIMNNINVTISNGKVTFYQNNWNDNADFPAVKNVMSQEDIFDKISEYQKFELKYVWNSENNLVLVYNFSTDNNYLYEPFKGTRIDYQGKTYKDSNINSYSDIEGHWCENIVNKLLENGYYIEGDSFNPDSSITQINFFKYLYSHSRYDNDDDFYDMLKRSKIIKQSEIKPNSPITKIDAAKFIVRYLNYDDIAKISKIYSDGLFKDEVKYNDIGYANICYGLGIIELDKNDKFNPDDNITNAETAQIIYNLLSIK